MTVYTRPARTKASAVGNEQRTRFTRILRRRAFDLLPTAEVMATEEAVTNTIRSRRGRDRAAWTTIRARFDQVGLLDLLRQRHLKNTGKELSRAEALAAVMAAGLETIIASNEFKRTAAEQN